MTFKLIQRKRREEDNKWFKVEEKQFPLYAEDHNKIINLVTIENGESAMREDQKVLRVRRSEKMKMK
jgi:hypothetical protein